MSGMKIRLGTWQSKHSIAYMKLRLNLDEQNRLRELENVVPDVPSEAEEVIEAIEQMYDEAHIQGLTGRILSPWEPVR